MNIRYYISKILKKLHIPAIKRSKIHDTSKVGSFSNLLNVNIGKYSYIGNFSTIIYADIGNYCSVADNVVIGGASHPIDWISTSPVFYSGKNIMNKHFSSLPYQPYKRTIIKNDVWIGSNCLIKAGIIIDNGAIIGMGSVVTKNIGAYEIWAGNPAKMIRKRFTDEEIIKLINSSWWDWNDEKINFFSNIINDKEKFFEYLLKYKDEFKGS